MFIADPDSTCRVITDPDPNPTYQVVPDSDPICIFFVKFAQDFRSLDYTIQNKAHYWSEMVSFSLQFCSKKPDPLR